MIEPFQNRRRADTVDLTDRQRDVADLVERYFAVAREVPSSGWVSRRLHISRQRAGQLMEALRRKGWCAPRE